MWRIAIQALFLSSIASVSQAEELASAAAFDAAILRMVDATVPASPVELQESYGPCVPDNLPRHWADGAGWNVFNCTLPSGPIERVRLVQTKLYGWTSLSIRRRECLPVNVLRGLATDRWKVRSEYPLPLLSKTLLSRDGGTSTLGSTRNLALLP